METRVITVARQVGALGEEVARIVADELKFHLLDYRVVQAAAEEAGVSTETVADAEHKPSFFTRVIESLARNPSTQSTGVWMEPLSMAATPLLTSSDYREMVAQVVEDFAQRGDVVILGHGAQFTLAHRPDTLRVLVTGNVDARKRRVMAGMVCSEEQAAEVVARTDSERTGYCRQFFHADWLSAAQYDVCVNTDHMNPSQAAQVILGAIAARAGRSLAAATL
ncbi:MAG TPA: cytidylate kinase-like family protein [Tepidiformaceae bacterium]|nr:cytidylate kinase-like family protein [Tepidiformaceae bacterium]